MEITTEFAVLIPIVTGVVQAIKMAGISSRFAPVLSLIIGIAGAFLIGGMDTVSALAGVVAGLSASGLFSGVKATFKG